MREQHGQRTIHPEVSDSTPALRGAGNATPVYLCGAREKKRKDNGEKHSWRWKERRGELGEWKRQNDNCSAGRLIEESTDWSSRGGGGTAGCKFRVKITLSSLSLTHTHTATHSHTFDSQRLPFLGVLLCQSGPPRPSKHSETLSTKSTLAAILGASSLLPGSLLVPLPPSSYFLPLPFLPLLFYIEILSDKWLKH